MACTPKDVYTALTRAGFSTNQAVGAMANAIAESSLNPEARAVDSNGYYSNGLWQFNERSYPNSGALVTGNCQADIAAQVGLLKSAAPGQALAGASAGEVAGNFARYFERCATCQPGQASYNQRVANAATVAGWVSSGKWPVSAAGLPTTGSGSSSTGGGGPLGPDCAFGVGGGKIGAAGVGATLPTVCLVKKATIRHIVGGALMVAGGATAGLGVILLAAFAFRASGAQRAAVQIAGTVSPAGRAVSAQTQRHQATVRSAERDQQRQAARDAQKPRGRHARTGPNAPAQGRHAAETG